MLLFEEMNDLLIKTLIAHKWATIQELHKFVKSKTSISLPNFYKLINKLIKQQILIKENGKLSLHNRRVLGFLNLADELKNAYSDEKTALNNLQEGQSLYHEASSIESLDGVWWDRMLQVNSVHWKHEPSYVYQARPYYALGMHDTEMAFFKEAKKLAEVYFLCSNTKFLDLYGISCYTNIWIPALAVDNLPFMKEGYCVTVIGSYVFEVLYPKEISDYFNIFFESITSMDTFNPELFYRIFTMKANCKLTLRKDAVQAERIKEVFIKAFKKEAARLK